MRHDTTGAGLGVVGIAFCLIGFVAVAARTSRVALSRRGALSFTAW